VNNYNIN